MTARLQQLLKNSQLWRNLLQAFTAFCWFLVAVVLARFTWSLVGPGEPDVPATLPKVSVGAAASSKFNTDTLVKLHLFGKAASNNQTQSTRNAPKTSLNVRLIGVSASSNPERSAAIIQQGSTQRTYIIGETLGSSSVSVEEIHADRVILDNNGRLETLTMENIGEDRPALSLVVGKARPEQNTNDASNELSDAETAAPDVAQKLATVADDPSSLLDYVSISPVQRGGQLVGYQLRPGKNAELFHQAGFRAGDLATAINGYDLTDMSQAMLASQELSELDQVSIEIERDGERMELSFELPNK